MNLNKTICVFFVILLLCGLLPLDAQQLHLPEAAEMELTKTPVFCTPGTPNKSRGKGLVIQYGLNGEHFWGPRNGAPDGPNFSEVSRTEHFKAKIKIPFINKQSLKLLGGYEYNFERFNFDEFGGERTNIFQSLDGKHLKTNKFTLYMTKSFNGKYYAVAQARASYRGDYNGLNSFDGRYAAYSGALVFGVKPKPYVEWGVGLSFSTGFNRTRVLPFAVYNKTFNSKWGIETVLPVSIKGRYNFSRNCIMLFGAEYASNNYSVDLLNDQSITPAEYHLRHAEIRPEVSLEQHLFSWIWLNVKAGYQVPVRTEFLNQENADLSFRGKSGSQPYFRVGLFLSPSDDLMK